LPNEQDLGEMPSASATIRFRTRQSVSDLIHSFSVSGILADLPQYAGAGGAKLLERIKRFIMMKDNKGVMLLNKDTGILP
jgi:uncharacterized protein